MKPFTELLAKLPPEQQLKIAAETRRKVTAIRLQQAREQVGLTQAEMAQRLNMTQPALSRFERRPNMTISVLQRYVEALGGQLEINVILPKQKKAGKCRWALAPEVLV
jgi:transcriptional regulator with XRE-family HTH domain